MEGVMGLFDGARRSEGSSAALATLLDLPVILVLNAKAMAYTAAALLYGLKHFDPRLRIAGVIFNFVDSPSHYRLLQEACDDVGIKALGHLPTDKSLRIPARHLGLDTADATTAIEAAADHIARHLDLPALLTATASPARQTPQAPAADAGRRQPAHGTRRVLIARDPAFHFLYPENIRRLEQWGRIDYFSPLRESHLPGDTDLLYLPGGYPELYAETLSNNTPLLEAIRAFAGGGKGKILAECGGMMFLGQSITDESGKAWPMAGVLDIATSIEKKKLTLGYRSTELGGHTLKGHEFHYSYALGSPGSSPGSSPESSPGLSSGAITRNSQGQPTHTTFFYEPTIFATYMHVYWGEDPSLLYEWLG
jgi:cobyrinic acid a,c-diamide synthase